MHHESSVILPSFFFRDRTFVPWDEHAMVSLIMRIRESFGHWNHCEQSTILSKLRGQTIRLHSKKSYEVTISARIVWCLAEISGPSWLIPSRAFLDVQAWSLSHCASKSSDCCPCAPAKEGENLFCTTTRASIALCAVMCHKVVTSCLAQPNIQDWQECPLFFVPTYFPKDFQCLPLHSDSAHEGTNIQFSVVRQPWSMLWGSLCTMPFRLASFCLDVSLCLLDCRHSWQCASHQSCRHHEAV